MEKNCINTIRNYWRGINKIIEEDRQHSSKQLGLTVAEEQLLRIIHFEKEVTISEIAKIGLWNRSTAMQIVNRAKTKGLINIIKKTSDRRVTYVTLSDQGVELQKESQNTYEYRIINFLENFLAKSSENEKLIIGMNQIIKEITENFYGIDFVEWIERTKNETH